MDPVCFSEVCNKSRLDVISHISRENDLRKLSPSKSNLASKLSRLAKLWILFGKSLVLHGVNIDGTVVADEPQKTLALGRAWQPTFKKKEFDEGAAIAYLQTLGNIGEYSSNLQGPDYFCFYSSQYISQVFDH